MSATTATSRAIRPFTPTGPLAVDIAALCIASFLLVFFGVVARYAAICLTESDCSIATSLTTVAICTTSRPGGPFVPSTILNAAAHVASLFLNRRAWAW